MTSIRKSTLSPQNEDTDAYWNSSGFKRFNFNDDDEEEDSIDVIRWDGSTATPIKPKSQPTREAPASGTTSSARLGAGPVTSARFHSAKKNQFPPSPAVLPPAVSRESKSSLSDQSARSSLDQKSASDASSHSSVNITDVVKLESEIFALQRQLRQAKRDSAAAPSRNETLTRFLVGGSYVLEQYKSMEDKAALLDGAMERHDGNAIVAITLFMRDTLKRDLFSKELMKRPVAVDHYCAYLRDADEIDELHETLSALGRTEEAAMLKYRQCISSTASSSPEIRIRGLRDCVKYYFDSDTRLSNETNAILEQISLLERQSVVEDADSSAEKGGLILIFKSHPRKDSLLFQSVITTLYYCCYYHWGEAEGLLSSPVAIRKRHRVSERQFHYIAIAALCRMRKWRDLETLLTTPRTLLRGARLYAPIGFERVVDILSKNLAPPDALEKYCAEIEGSERRLEMGIKCKCHKVVIDTYVHIRDRQRMMEYLDQIPVGNDFLRQHLLNQSRSSDIKWKN